MKVGNARQVFLNGAFLFALAVVLAASASSGTRRAEQQSSGKGHDFQIDTLRSKIHWTLGTTLHTVHGTFALKRGDVRIHSADSKAAGEIVVDAISGESGNDSRDKKMHSDILESNKYSIIVFRPDRVDGLVPAQGSADLKLHGVFSLHGTDHEMLFPMHVEISGMQWKGSGKFIIPYIQWGLKNPSTFLLKADPQVEIELELSGTVQDDSNNS